MGRSWPHAKGPTIEPSTWHYGQVARKGGTTTGRGCVQAVQPAVGTRRRTNADFDAALGMYHWNGTIGKYTWRDGTRAASCCAEWYMRWTREDASSGVTGEVTGGVTFDAKSAAATAEEVATASDRWRQH